MIRLMLVDDQRLMRDGLQTLLGREPDLSIVGLASNGAEALTLQAHHPADVVLMDIRMPVLDGIEATRAMVQQYPATKVLMLTTYEERDDVVRALSAGAIGYLLKDMPAEAIAAAIRTAWQGGAVLPLHMARSMAEPQAGSQTSVRSLDGPIVNGSDGLTDRELDVLRCLASGYSNKEIAQRLFVTEGTVKNHVSNLIAKLGLRDRTQAALFAVRHGLGPLDPAFPDTDHS